MEINPNSENASDKSSSRATAASPYKKPDHLVQIKADKKEVQRRIDAFVTRKRREVDELNLQEFCNLPRAEMATEFSCARVDAQIVPRSGSKGHVKVSRVVNQWGPQTAAARLRPDNEDHSNESSRLPQSVDERLRNMESHLQLTAGMPVPADIYGRLKNLEERILFLEGLSPDYFSIDPYKMSKGQTQVAERRTSSLKQDLSLAEIDARIEALNSSLRSRMTGGPTV